ncbi:hypothetical protein CspeluHIS016_0300240 [Cutaneotrichosporon spelunceum]|uniref:DUF3844 domain-containing protein n=1 Tax=Cutaneotrichosporon spelunceum TaxID=1672016 RepID=A0AAD3YBV2_9TREE|nr:hypothetical protein CspeluHIS016_0300240 [Cutaneotrichosporon spelunceum]
MRTQLLLLPVALAATQVYLFPAPEGAHAPMLNAEQASAVMSHHLGSDISEQDTPKDEGMWAHLLNLWDNGEKRPRVVILEGGHAQDILPPSLSSPSFYISDDAESVLEPFKKAANETLERVAQLPIVKQLLDTLDLAKSKLGKALSTELSALVALADSLWSSTSAGWDAVYIRLDKAVEDSELWNTASSGVQAGLKSMTQPDSPPLLVIVQDAQPRFHYARQIEEPDVDAAKKNKHKTTTKAEPTSTPTPNPRPVPKPKPAPTYHDYSAPFALLTGTAVLLFLFAAGGVMLLSGIGEEPLPSTLNLSAGGRKHD